MLDSQRLSPLEWLRGLRGVLEELVALTREQMGMLPPHAQQYHGLRTMRDRIIQ